MLAEGFFEKLTGYYRDGVELSEVPLVRRRSKSILDHLRFLLNTRKGMLIHIPEYGMPDIGEMYRRLPEAAAEMRESVEFAIRRFEPRLEHVRVSIVDFDPGIGHVGFRVSAVIAGGARLVMETRFFPDGRGAILAGES
jgi:type VI secretion system protein